MRQTLLFVMAFMLVACSAAAADYKAVSTGVRYTHLGDYSVERLNRILTTEVAAFSSFKVQYPQAANAVSLYKVQYTTVIPELGNKPTLASGLVAVPQTAQKKLPVVSYQHGGSLAARRIGRNAYSHRPDGWQRLCGDRRRLHWQG